MFHKLVAIEPAGLLPWAEEELKTLAANVVFYPNVPADDAEIAARIGDADAVLINYTSRLEGAVMARCPKLQYVGMCCSLYSKESANVDIAWAEKNGVTVTGIRDYGDRGVVEYVLCELIRHLHGFDRPLWKETPVEITGLNVGMVGLGVSGGMVADALQTLGANIRYFCRGPKPEYEARGMAYTPLHELLQKSDAVFCCLNKNVLLLGPAEFEALGTGKLLFNTSIGPAFTPADLAAWLDKGGNVFCCDTPGALGDPSLEAREDVFCAGVSAGRTSQAFELLSRKVLDNILAYQKAHSLPPT